MSQLYSSCQFNANIECTQHVGCKKCGWNPKCAEKRKRKIRGSIAKKSGKWIVGEKKKYGTKWERKDEERQENYEEA